MNTYYITFGTDHNKTINNIEFGYTCPAKIEANNYEEAHKIALILFDRKWCDIYDNADIKLGIFTNSQEAKFINRDYETWTGKERQAYHKTIIAKETVYIRNGYNDRGDYLEQMAEQHGVALDTVIMVSDVLGSNEDFDGLVTTLQDAELMGIK